MKSERPKELVQAELWISHVLRYGVVASGGLIAGGLFMAFFRPSFYSSPAGSKVALDLIQGQVLLSRSAGYHLGDVRDGLLKLDPDAWIALGVMFLIALPIARVGMTVLLFLIERDWLYLGITLFVFCTLSFGLIFGKAL